MYLNTIILFNNYTYLNHCFLSDLQDELLRPLLLHVYVILLTLYVYLQVPTRPAFGRTALLTALAFGSTFDHFNVDGPVHGRRFAIQADNAALVVVPEAARARNKLRIYVQAALDVVTAWRILDPEVVALRIADKGTGADLNREQHLQVLARSLKVQAHRHRVVQLHDAAHVHNGGRHHRQPVARNQLHLLVGVNGAGRVFQHQVLYLL